MPNCGGSIDIYSLGKSKLVEWCLPEVPVDGNPTPIYRSLNPQISRTNLRTHLCVAEAKQQANEINTRESHVNVEDYRFLRVELSCVSPDAAPSVLNPSRLQPPPPPFSRSRPPS